MMASDITDTGYVINVDIRRKWQQQIKQAEEAMTMYKSPIAFMLTDKQVQLENGVLKAVQDVGIIVDKAVLLKALAYDHEQYQRGYADGREAGHEWISVWDRLPEDQRDVLTVNGHGNIRMMGFWSKRGEQLMWLHNGRFKHYNDITHWMPLPEPPKEGNE